MAKELTHEEAFEKYKSILPAYPNEVILIGLYPLRYVAYHKDAVLIAILFNYLLSHHVGVPKEVPMVVISNLDIDRVMEVFIKMYGLKVALVPSDFESIP